MIVDSLQIRNFRGIEKLDIDFHDKLNVLVGENGSGKSSILDGLGNMLSYVHERIRSKPFRFAPFSRLDIKNTHEKSSFAISAKEIGKQYSWNIEYGINNSRKDLTELKDMIDRVHTNAESDPLASLPLIVHYRVDRSGIDIPARIKTRHQFEERYSAFENSINGTGNFRMFFEWFREREGYLNERLADGEKNPTDIQLQSVKKAITELTGFDQLKVRRLPQRMLLNKGGLTLDVGQLSDGEKCLLAMVGDMAMRLAIANPSHPNPLQCQAVFLIDEIDLHLHPAWQRNIVPKLIGVFPNCQFIVTTHATQVLTHVKPESVFLLRSTLQGIVIRHPEESYGQNQDSLYEDLMGVPIRPDEVGKAFRELFDAIDGNDITVAKARLSELRNAIGSDPELVRADILIRKKGAH